MKQIRFWTQSTHKIGFWTQSAQRSKKSEHLKIKNARSQFHSVCSVSKKLPLTFAMFVLAACASFAPGGRSVNPEMPSTTMLRGEHLAETRSRLQQRDPSLLPAFNNLLRAADSVLTAPAISVMQKKTIPPSGNKHDFLSLAPYWWPDPTKPNGLPYIQRDGEINPATRTDHDGLRFQAMVDGVEALALANYFTGDRKYSARAAQLLRVFFLDTATLMNPNLQYAQAVLGVNQGRGIGIIDLRVIPQLIDAEQLLRNSGDWSASDHEGLVRWCRAYLTWLLESKNGKDERAAENNHGTWIDAQLAALALYVKDTALARTIFVETRTRIERQIRADGSQPLELARTRPLHYSVFNLDAYTQIAEMARHTGDDVWNYVAPSGGSLRQALLFVAQFTDSARVPPKPDIVPVTPEEFATPLRRAVMVLPDTTLLNALRRLPADSTTAARGSLLYPRH